MMNPATQQPNDPATFLLEIGTEELPSADLDSALEQLYAAFIELAQKENLDFAEKSIEAMGTPRRLAVLIRDFPTKQEEIISKKVKGPPASVAYKDGKPTQAATGFAKAQGIKVDDILVESTPKGDYLFAVSAKPGRASVDILSENLASIIQSVEFKKSMRWQDDARFIRPIRWLVALLGPKVIPFNYGAVKSANVTFGHRLLAPRSFNVKNASDYKQVMNQARVVVNPEDRARKVERALHNVKEGSVEIEDIRIQKTFCEVINLVESPQIITGSFDRKFLKLPKTVVETVLQSHQRYFPVLKNGGSSHSLIDNRDCPQSKGVSPQKLTNFFVIVHNGNPKYNDLIRHGHQKVVQARLEDAEFYLAEDSHRKLSEHVKDLAGITFHEGLGNLFDKTKRLKSLVKKIATELNISGEEKETVSAAAKLSKADLLTSMVAEFDELQGAIGAQYALKEGYSKSIAKAIFEQYLPRQANDAIPQTAAGKILSIADRIDTLCAYASIGILPSSTGDPYALRRQSTGLVDVLFASKYKLSTLWLAKTAYKNLKEFKNIESELFVVEETAELINQRVEYLLSKMGVDYDIIRAVAALKLERPVEFKLRAIALQDIRSSDKIKFDDLVTACDRAYSIADRSLGTKVDSKLLLEAAEKKLYRELLQTRQQLDKAIAQDDYKKAIKLLASLRKAVDDFFDQVLVMAEDAKVKKNRHALLNNFTAACQMVADLSRIVKSS